MSEYDFKKNSNPTSPGEQNFPSLFSENIGKIIGILK
jgi:hypothetical protein